MNILVGVDKELWAKVKYYATINELTLSKAVNDLLDTALSQMHVKERQANKIRQFELDITCRNCRLHQHSLCASKTATGGEQPVKICCSCATCKGDNQ